MARFYFSVSNQMHQHLMTSSAWSQLRYGELLGVGAVSSLPSLMAYMLLHVQEQHGMMKIWCELPVLSACTQLTPACDGVPL